MAMKWTEVQAKVYFEFVPDDADSEVRIAFRYQDDSGSWSAIGTDALLKAYFPADGPTMNFGWLTDDTELEEYERVVVHEFGHALGCIHEHQNPKATLDWDYDKVFAYFSKPPNNWDKASIEHNILSRYSSGIAAGSEFDPDSIMLYMFPAALFKTGGATNNNTKLSENDKAYIRTLYGETAG
jgi:hypothetical protein